MARTSIQSQPAVSPPCTVPFPDLSTSPPSYTRTRSTTNGNSSSNYSSPVAVAMPRRREQHPTKSPSSSPKKQRRVLRHTHNNQQTVHMIPPTITTTLLLSSSAPQTKSAPISLPASHVRRTPSELQLEADTLHAEYKDVVMYSRLITGMHTQMLSRSDPRNIHPLTSKSMVGVFKTKQANDDELEQPYLFDQRNAEWDMSNSPIDEEGAGAAVGSSSSSSSSVSSSSVASSSLSLQSQLLNSATNAEPATDHGQHLRQASREYSLSSLIDDIENGGCDLEDDCVFSLEL